MFSPVGAEQSPSGQPSVEATIPRRIFLKERVSKYIVVGRILL